jgi:hypothetical protein
MKVRFLNIILSDKMLILINYLYKYAEMPGIIMQKTMQTLLPTKWGWILKEYIQITLLYGIRTYINNKKHGK